MGRALSSVYSVVTDVYQVVYWPMELMLKRIEADSFDPSSKFHLWNNESKKYDNLPDISYIMQIWYLPATFKINTFFKYAHC